MSEVDPITTPTPTPAPAAQAAATEEAVTTNAGPINCNDKKAVMAGLLAKANLSDAERELLGGGMKTQAKELIGGAIFGQLGKGAGSFFDLGVGAAKAAATKKLFDATHDYECKDAAQEMLNPSPIKSINPLKFLSGRQQ